MQLGFRAFQRRIEAELLTATSWRFGHEIQLTDALSLRCELDGMWLIDTTRPDVAPRPCRFELVAGTAATSAALQDAQLQQVCNLFADDKQLLAYNPGRLAKPASVQYYALSTQPASGV